MQILIKRSGTTILTVKNPLSSSDYQRTLMGDNTVTLVWEQPTYTSLLVGDYIIHDSVKFTINQLPTVKKLSTKLYQYNAVFQSPIYDLLKAGYMLFDNTATIPSGDFSLTGTPAVFMQLLVDNLNRVFGTSNFFLVGQVIDAEAKTLTFSNENCFEVLTRLATEFDTEYSLDDGIIINLIEISNTTNLTLEYGSTIYDIERKSIDSSSVITRLYPRGSEKNIAATYRNGSSRLLLPNPLQYLEANVALYGVIEGQKTFDAIYPRLGATSAGTVTTVYFDNKLKFTDVNLDFNLNSYLLPGTSAKLRFTTGQCAGYDLEIKQFTNSTKTFVVIQNEDDKGFKIPNGDIYPAVGDKYVLLDVNMPPAYVTAAELELQAKAQEYINENSHPKVSYTVTFSSVWAKVNAPDLRPGDLVEVYDADLGISTNLRVIKIVKGISDSYNVKVDLSDTVSKSTLTRIAAEIAANTAGITEVKKGVSQNFSRNWRNVEELSTMIDTLRADMLFVGNVQGQFVLSGVLFTPNYQNDKNKFYATAGSLIHKTIPSDATPGTWTLPAYAPTITGDTTPYYLYAKCSRTATTGVFYLSANSIVYDSDAAYYYFLVGVLSSVTDGVRTLQTTYGFTQITGKQVVTGTVQSSDGSTYFNLDTGEIGGNIKFKSGSTYTEVGIGIKNAVNDLQIGARNLIKNSKTQRSCPYIAYNDIISLPLTVGKSYIVSAKSNITPTESYMRKQSTGYSISQNFSFDTPFVASNAWDTILIAGTNIVISEVQLEEGNKKTGWKPAIEDVDASVAAAQEAADEAFAYADDAYTSAQQANEAIVAISSDNMLSASEKSGERLRWNSLYAEKSGINQQAATYLITTENNTFNSAFQALANYLNNGITWSSGTPAWLSDVNMNVDNPISGTAYRAKWSDFYTARQALLNAISTKAKQLADTAQSTVDNLQIGGRNFIINSKTPRSSSYIAYNDIISTPLVVGKSYIVSAKSNITPTESYMRKQSTGYSISQNFSFDTPFVASNAWDTILIAGTNIVISEVQLEEGNKKTGWKPAIEDTQAEIAEAKAAANAAETVSNAIANNLTTIDGGLILTTLIKMLNGSAESAGMAAKTAQNDIAFWGGGSLEQAIQRLTNFGVTHSGEAWFKGIIEALGGKIGGLNISENSLSSATMEFTEEPIETLDSLKVSETSTFTMPWDNFNNTFIKVWGNPSATITSPTFTANKGSFVAFRVITNYANLAVLCRIKDSSNNIVSSYSYTSDGTYKAVKLELYSAGNYTIECTATGSSLVSIAIIGETDWKTVNLYTYNQRTKIGNNGLYSFWDIAKYFYFSSLTGLSIRCGIDIPGGLGGGSFASGGGLANPWGVKPPTGCSGASTKTITHNIGDTNYTIIVVMTSNSSYYVTGKTSTQIQIVTSGSADFIFLRTI